ncbi:iron export ABC transporter permease subunit FetB [Ignavigranum ruoffiae]|uniref:ABC transporter permease n=1 Tax=Ignavigranum ruoffiae TaxID=89093 RepID=UPI003B0089DF
MNNNLQATPLSVALSFALVLLTLFVSYREKLKLEKDIIISVVRMIVQLIVIGLILQWIFRVNNVWLTLIMVLVMIVNAAWNAGKRGKGIENSFIYSLIAISLSSFIALSVMVGSGTLEFTPAQIIPMNGMIIGTTMQKCGMVFNYMRQIFKDRQQQINEMLALGANAKQASKEVIKIVINDTMQPTLDSIKTTGLVTLPGLMAGLMFAGVDPAKAILYQIVIMFMMLSSTAIGAYTIAYLTYSSFFTKRLQLKMTR